ncbi:MAG: RDD family protein [Gammaproteobacteria bacterium]|nr:RDD family protein [Gammaproteobacteria bacterium]
MCSSDLFRRLAAALYDWLILGGLLVFTSFILIALRGGEAMPPGDPRFQAFLLAQMAAFFAGFWWYGGQTPGLRTWRLRVVRSDGGPLSPREAAFRFVLAIPSVALLGFGFWWVLVDGEGRSWHDHLSGTRLAATTAPVAH